MSHTYESLTSLTFIRVTYESLTFIRVTYESLTFI